MQSEIFFTCNHKKTCNPRFSTSNHNKDMQSEIDFLPVTITKPSDESELFYHKIGPLDSHYWHLDSFSNGCKIQN